MVCNALNRFVRGLVSRIRSLLAEGHQLARFRLRPAERDYGGQVADMDR
jgi:hypothetical protein